MKDVSLETLKGYLQSRDLSAEIQKETNQVYAAIKVDEIEFPMFLRIYDGGELLQILTFFPASLEDKAAADTARLLHLLNKELDIPGFGMDEGSKVTFFRCMVPIVKGEIADEVLNALMNATDIVCKNFAPAVVAVATGNATYDDVLKRAQEQQQASE